MFAWNCSFSPDSLPFHPWLLNWSMCLLNQWLEVICSRCPSTLPGRLLLLLPWIVSGAAGGYFGRVAVFWCLVLFALQVASEGRKAEGSLCLLCSRPERLLIHGTCPRKTIATWEMAVSHGWPFRSREILKEKCCCAQLPLCTCCYQKLPLRIPFLQSQTQILLQSITRGVSCWLLQDTCLRVAWNGSQTANPSSSLLVNTVA